MALTRVQPTFGLGKAAPAAGAFVFADAAPLPGSMRLVLIVLIVMSLISSVIAATWLQ